MSYRDPKQLLAKMSPEADGIPFSSRLESEYLHLCALLEAGLMYQPEGRAAKRLFEHYNAALESLFQAPQCAHYATWQQRTEALAKVKGIL